jgi:hypothetical protein
MFFSSKKMVLSSEKWFKMYVSELKNAVKMQVPQMQKMA